MNKKYIFVSLILVIAFTLASCKQLDVVANMSITSFEEVLSIIPDKIAEDEIYGGWSLSAPDESARFIWSKDFSKSKVYDVMLELDVQPFIDAGLDIKKLPEGIIREDKIILGTKLGNENMIYNGEAIPLASYEKIVELKRDSIKYHAALDHYGVDLTEGNMFEWAKDMSKNDKDIVFVVNPQMFLDAGVDATKVDGWVFAKIETMDMKGKTIEVDKFLKPFNLK